MSQVERILIDLYLESIVYRAFYTRFDLFSLSFPEDFKFKMKYLKTEVTIYDAF